MEMYNSQFWFQFPGMGKNWTGQNISLKKRKLQKLSKAEKSILSRKHQILSIIKNEFWNQLQSNSNSYKNELTNKLNTNSFTKIKVFDFQRSKWPFIREECILRSHRSTLREQIPEIQPKRKKRQLDNSK